VNRLVTTFKTADIVSIVVTNFSFRALLIANENE
jgi:hypothetical protein